MSVSENVERNQVGPTSERQFIFRHAVIGLLVLMLTACSSRDPFAVTPSSRLADSPTKAWPKETQPYGNLKQPVLTAYSTEGRVVHEDFSPYSDGSSYAGNTQSGVYSGSYQNSNYAGSGYGSNDSTDTSGRTVHVNGYYRSNGTYVSSYYRSPPHR